MRPRADAVKGCNVLLDELLTEQDLGLISLAALPMDTRAINGVYVTDLLDPRRYLHGGELVLSGLMWWTGPASSERFVAALAQAQVTALASGTARLGYAPRDLIEACERHGVPLVQVPVTVSFNTLAERVQNRSKPQRELVSAVAAGAELEHVLGMAAARTGADCWVLSAVGALVGGSADLPERLRAELLTRLPSSGVSARALCVDEDEFLVCAVDADTSPLPPRWWLVLRGGPAHADGRAAVPTDLTTAVALVRDRLAQVRRIASGAAEAALPQLFRGDATVGETVARLESAGLPAGQWLRAVALGAGDADTSVALLRELAAAADTAAVVVPAAETVGPGTALALFAADSAELSDLDDSLRRGLREGYPLYRGELVRDEEVAMGLSDVVAIRSLRTAVAEAGHALQLARTRASTKEIDAIVNRVVSAAELNTHDVLLASVPEALRDSYRARMLTELQDYDARHRSELVHTLRMFLAHSGSWSRCANALYVHVNTLRYRIRRIEQITGRDLGEFRTRVDFHLALRLERAE